MSNFSEQEGLSLIICCYNAEKRIIPTLRALQQQEFTSFSLPWEVVLVDNASTDRTVEVAEACWKENPVTNLVVVKEPIPGLMHARHKGLHTATCRIVSFIDDDNWVEPGWVEKVWMIFQDESIGACGGRSEAVFEQQEPDWFREYENNYAVGAQMGNSGIIDSHKGFLWGAGLSFRKALWTELNKRGFTNLTVGRQGKNITAGEDSELCYAFRLLGYHLYYRDDLSLRHYMTEGRMQFSYLRRMVEGFGKAEARLCCYRVLLEKDFVLHAWWYEWMSARKKMVQARRALKTESDPRKRREWMIQESFSRGYAAQVWRDKGKTKKMVARIRSVFGPQPAS